MRCYLAGPIDMMPEEHSWKDELKAWCKSHNNIVFYDPDTFSFGKITNEVSKFIHDVNTNAINLSDIIIAKWMSTYKGAGTLMELYYATIINKPIILITDLVDKSVYINYIGQYSIVVSNLNEAYGKILKFNDANKNESIITLSESISNKPASTLGHEILTESLQWIKQA